MQRTSLTAGQNLFLDAVSINFCGTERTAETVGGIQHSSQYVSHWWIDELSYSLRTFHEYSRKNVIFSSNINSLVGGRGRALRKQYNLANIFWNFIVREMIESKNDSMYGWLWSCSTFDKWHCRCYSSVKKRWDTASELVTDLWRALYFGHFLA